MNTIHQIPFVTKEIRPKLIEDGKPHFENSFRKISKCRYTSFLRNDYKEILKQFGITEILHTALACLVHAFVRGVRGRASHFSKAYAYEKHMGFRAR